MSSEKMSFNRRKSKSNDAEASEQSSQVASNGLPEQAGENQTTPTKQVCEKLSPDTPPKAARGVSDENDTRSDLPDGWTEGRYGSEQMHADLRCEVQEEPGQSKKIMWLAPRACRLNRRENETKRLVRSPSANTILSFLATYMYEEANDAAAAVHTKEGCF